MTIEEHDVYRDDYSNEEYAENQFSEDQLVPSERECSLKEEDPELYGFLLMANAKLSNVGTVSVFVSAFLAIGLCTGIHMEWFDNALQTDLTPFRSWGVYLLIMVGAIILWTYVIAAKERRVYQTMHYQVQDALKSSQLSVYQLIAEIEGVEELKNIAEQIKSDFKIENKVTPGRMY